MMKYLVLLLVSLLSLNAYAEKGSFGFVVSVATKGIFSPKLKTVEITEVTEGSSAYEAGILAGDHIVAIGDCPVPGCPVSEARKSMGKAVGETLNLTIKTLAGDEREVTLVAGPPNGT